MIAAALPVIVGLAAYVLFAIALTVLAIVAVRSLRSNQTLVRLRSRFPATSDGEDLQWVRPGQDGLIYGQGRAISINNLLIAYSPTGLHLRMQGLWSPIVDMPTVSIPWQFISCQHSSQFGFYKATIEIGGFEDGSTIQIQIRSTNRDFGKCIEHCTSASS